MKMIKLLITAFIFAGFAMVYWLWPHEQQLQILNTVNDFELENVHAETYQLTNGKVTLLNFFYTKCPDVCPLTMNDFKDIQAHLKNDDLFGHQVELVAITLDPETDTREIINNYARIFEADPSGWKWLRGSPEETKRIADYFQMPFQKLDGGYMAHGTTMYLIDENNQIRALYDMANPNKSVDKEKILEDIDILVNN